MHDFRTVVTFCALGVLTVVLLAPLVSGAARTLRFSFGSRLIAGLIALACIAWLTHSSMFGQFVSAEMDSSRVTLDYAGLFPRQVEIQHGEIKSVLVGTDGRYDSKCNIAFELHDTTHRSAWMPGPVATCRKLRQKILETLSLHQPGAQP